MIERQELKPKGWHSRRHQTSAAHHKARERWHAKKSRTAKQWAAKTRQELRDDLTPKAQLKRLDALLGAGKGATAERLRLHELVMQGVDVSPAQLREEAREALFNGRRAKSAA